MISITDVCTGCNSVFTEDVEPGIPFSKRCTRCRNRAGIYGRWRREWRCGSCHDYVRVPLDNITFVDRKVCPHCGEFLKNNVYDRIERWVSYSVWYKPWTWSYGFMEVRNGRSGTNNRD